MKAELVKRQDRWDLYGEDGSKKASSAPNPMGKLSISNCESIANGYDLDELVKNIKTEDGFEHKQSFISGFQKALEILGDKKFSEEDLVSFGKRCFYKGFEKSENDDANCYTAFREEIGEIIQSLQQTEFDVEIEMERSKFIAGKSLRNDIKNGFNYTPKLDADGCLILKRK